MESAEIDRAGITLRDHVDAVVAAIDEQGDAPVVLVGHSGGGAVAHAAVDARPDRVGRAIYVDSLPLGAGGVINDQLPVVNGEVPLPDWAVFDEESLVGLDDELRAAFRRRAIPTPARVCDYPQQLFDERRYAVPITVVACELPSSAYREFMEPDHPWHSYVEELMLVDDVEFIDLPTGHWPQFTRPDELGRLIVATVDRM
jgi:pimeloyl-ACP methyl ester carboxylesterase